MIGTLDKEEKDKDLYFFDEPTSNLDSLSEEKITNMIEKYLKDKVTHRPKLKELCNKHYIFENHMMKEIIINQEVSYIFIQKLSKKEFIKL